MLTLMYGTGSFACVRRRLLLVPLRHADRPRRCPFPGEDRKWRFGAVRTVFDPGCVKTPCCCYDSPVILREESMRRFVEEADRGQWTLLPECLDDFIDESNHEAI